MPPRRVDGEAGPDKGKNHDVRPCPSRTVLWEISMSQCLIDLAEHHRAFQDLRTGERHRSFPVRILPPSQEERSSQQHRMWGVGFGAGFEGVVSPCLAVASKPKCGQQRHKRWTKNEERGRALQDCGDLAACRIILRSAAEIRTSLGNDFWGGGRPPQQYCMYCSR